MYEYVVNFSNIGLREFSTLPHRLEIPTFPELTYVKQSFVFKAPVQLSPILHSKNFGIFTPLFTVQNETTFSC